MCRWNGSGLGQSKAVLDPEPAGGEFSPELLALGAKRISGVLIFARPKRLFASETNGLLTHSFPFRVGRCLPIEVVPARTFLFFGPAGAAGAFPAEPAFLLGQFVPVVSGFSGVFHDLPQVPVSPVLKIAASMDSQAGLRSAVRTHGSHYPNKLHDLKKIGCAARAAQHGSCPYLRPRKPGFKQIHSILSFVR